MSNNEDCCFARILKVIDLLQRNVEKIENIDDSCTRPFLGGCSLRNACFNTRPVTFYTCQNTLFTINYQDDEDSTIIRSSSIFRVEKIDGCCVTVLILEENPDTTDPNRPYVSTGQFATINLNCVCALQCLPDIIIDCL